MTANIHVVLDNLSTHKPKHDRWLARHKNLIFHYTPTHTSWLNQIEIWFSIALLTGLVRCGRCGRTVRVFYGSRSGHPHRYQCRGDDSHVGGWLCIGIGGVRIDWASPPRSWKRSPSMP